MTRSDAQTMLATLDRATQTLAEAVRQSGMAGSPDLSPEDEGEALKHADAIHRAQIELGFLDGHACLEAIVAFEGEVGPVVPPGHKLMRCRCGKHQEVVPEATLSLEYECCARGNP